MSFKPDDEWAGYIPPTPFSEYSARYSAFFRMRREGGILEARLHTKDGPYVHSAAAHNAWARVWQDIGNDPDNHVLIITGTGDKWFTGNPETINPKPASELDPDHTFQRMSDGWKLIESFINNIDIPTISAVNGSGVHTEFAMMCDVTFAAPDADFMDPHFWLGSPPVRPVGHAQHPVAPLEEGRCRRLRLPHGAPDARQRRQQIPGSGSCAAARHGKQKQVLQRHRHGLMGGGDLDTCRLSLSTVSSKASTSGLPIEGDPFSKSSRVGVLSPA